MNDMNLKVAEFFKSKGIQDAANFATVLVNAIIAAYNAGLLKIEEAPVKCEKCGGETSEWVISITGVFKWLFSFRLTAIIHAFYDDKCGRSYFRIKFAK